ncbi:MAG: hypothetical protein ABL876_14215, partial [Chitinophagaceae bacterium]
KMSDATINLFTGVPLVSVPIHNYKSNSGIGMSISLEYNGGGVQVAESPTTVGLSWFLSAGGTITRTVKGLPDDMPNDGYLYAGSIPTDWRANDSKYYNDSLDAAPDIFQFSYPGGSGRFFLGKNGQILVSPTSKIKVIPAFRTPDIILPTTLKSFRVVAEDGVKYDFEEADYTWYAQDNSYFPPGFPYTYSAYEGKSYPVVWYLTRIISPFYSDTIKLNYQTAGGGEYSFKFPQITYVNNSNGTRLNPTSAPGYGGGGSKKISSIEFPDKTTVSFVYSYNTKYSHNDYALSKIKVSDTAFRFGYLLDYQISHTYMLNGHPHIDSTRLLLKSVTPFTKNEKQEGYKFDYNTPLLPKLGDGNDTIQNKRDHWGYYNGALNGQNLIPNVNGYTWGADRSPNNNALANSLSKVYLPTGGYMLYYYALNDHFPYTKQANQLSIAPATNTQNNITLNQVFNTKHQLQFFLDKSVSRSGSAPLTGSGMLNLYIKSTDGSVTYLSSSISLYDLFYSGLRTWTFNLINGTYRLETSLSSGSGISGNFPVNINWENKNIDNSQNYNLAGGIRVTSISKQYSGIAGTSSFTIYNYIREDGKSSGFLGDIPRYDYPYRVVVNNTGAITDYTAVSSEPVSPTDYAQGSPVGYSRVEAVTSSLAGNLGKEVYEFTDLKDVNGNGFSNVFPYIPNDTRSWGLGLPKRISVYDSSGALVKRTVNTYQLDTIINTSSNFKAIKLGHSQTNYSTDPNYPPVSKKKTFIGHEYYPLTGKAYLVYSADTLFQPNGSLNTSWQQLYYDTNYNVTKVVTSYDRNRNLVKEQRMYYPYNYTVGGGIGKLRDSAILSQMVATETWVTGDGNPRILSGAVTSFRQIANGDLKPDTIYSFESNKPVVQASIGVFDPAKLNRNTTYFKAQNYFTTYDTKGNLTEMKNLVSGRSNSTLLDYDQKYPIANISNATQADIAYTGFEAAGTGNWNVGSTQRDIAYNLTGKKSYNLSNGNITKTSLSSSQSYLLTVWAKSGASVSVNSTALTTSIATQNNWNLYSVSLTGITSVTVSGSGLIDELRLHPKDANMTTSAYEPMIGVISSVDANNTVGYTEYDKLNRVKLIRDKDKNIMKRFDYSDTTMLVSTAPLWQGFDKRCSPTFPGQIDSAYRDMNIFSDSSGYVKYIYQGYLDCSCAEVQGNPQYAVINGTCEMGTWKVVSSEYKKVLVNGFLEWRWVCTYKWCFSNGTTTSYFNETYNMSPCTVTCGSSTD